MKRLLFVLSLALVGTGCATDDEAPVDAAQFGGADCGCVSDTPIDTPPSACDACGPGTVCVQLLGGTCGSSQVTCEPVVAGCDQPVCSTACDQAYCDPGGVSTCMGPPCPGVDIPGALHCYGV
jgi:hypothetical protein